MRKHASKITYTLLLLWVILAVLTHIKEAPEQRFLSMAVGISGSPDIKPLAEPDKVRLEYALPVGSRFSGAFQAFNETKATISFDLIMLLDYRTVPFVYNGKEAVVHSVTLPPGQEVLKTFTTRPLGEGVHRFMMVLLPVKPPLAGDEVINGSFDLRVGASAAPAPTPFLSDAQPVRGDKIIAAEVRRLSDGYEFTATVSNITGSERDFAVIALDASTNDTLTIENPYVRIPKDAAARVRFTAPTGDLYIIAVAGPHKDLNAVKPPDRMLWIEKTSSR